MALSTLRREEIGAWLAAEKRPVDGSLRREWKSRRYQKRAHCGSSNPIKTLPDPYILSKGVRLSASRSIEVWILRDRSMLSRAISGAASSRSASRKITARYVSVGIHNGFNVMSPAKPMPSSSSISCVLVPFLHCFLVAACVALPRDADLKTLRVGEEIKAETLPIRSGRRTYELLGLRRSSSYEVKISYPASIPAKFSIRLQRPGLELRSTKNRRLLDTEKLIFKAEQEESVFVSLTVENGGIIAKKNVPERELVIYNIVCDELVLGIPHDAWRVGIAALLCLLLGVVLSNFLFLPLLINKGLEAEDAAAVTKDS